MFQPCIAIIVRWSPLRPRIIERSPISAGRSRQSRGKHHSRSPRKIASVKRASTAERQRPHQPPRQHVSGCPCGKPSNVDDCARAALATHCRRTVNSSLGRCRAFLLMCMGSEGKKSRSRNLNGDVWVGNTQEVRRSFLPPQILAAPHQTMVFAALRETLCNAAQRCCGNQAGKRKRKSVVCSQEFE